MISYYGLFRIGEISLSPHVIKAINVHKGTNKDKILFILYSSKTHGKNNRPQQVKIIGGDYLEVTTYKSYAYNYYEKRMFCPVEIVYKYLEMRPIQVDDNEQFLVFSDRSPVKPQHVRKVLREILENLKLDSKLYDTHSFRIGRATDMEKSEIPIDKIKQLGRWKSNAVYKYLRNT